MFSEAHQDMLHPGYPHIDDDADPVAVPRRPIGRTSRRIGATPLRLVRNR